MGIDRFILRSTIHEHDETATESKLLGIAVACNPSSETLDHATVSVRFPSKDKRRAVTDYMELWKCSFWLSDCPRTYAADFYKKERKAANEHAGNKLWIEDLKDAAGEGKSQGYEGLELFAYSAKKICDLGKPKHELLKMCTQELIQKLKSGRYRAFGFDRPRTLDLKTVQVPKEAWVRATKRDDSTL